MVANDSMRETLEYFRQQRHKKMEEIRQVESTIRQLEGELGLEPTDFAIGPQLSASAEENEPINPTGFTGQRKSETHADEFFGLSQPEAARRYLKKAGHAVTVEEVLEALRAGGCEVGGSDPKKVLYISMVRDTRNFVKLPNGLIGLRDFYGDRRLTPAKKEKVRKRKSGGRSARQIAKKEEPPTE